MDRLSAKFWGIVQQKLGPSITGFLGPIAKSLSVDIKNEDAEAISKRADELIEFGDEIKNLGTDLKTAVADGKLDGIEAKDLILQLEAVVDEGEDVVTGVDEDDPVEDPTNPEQ